MLLLLSGAGLPYPSLVRALLGVGLILMFIGQGLRIFCLSPSLGPLVLMFFRMVSDVLRWCQLVSVVLVGFGAAFYTLFKARTLYSLQPYHLNALSVCLFRELCVSTLTPNDVGALATTIGTLPLLSAL